jgi:hypothetical protein
VLAASQGWISQRAAWAEGLIHEVDTVQVVAESREVANPDLDCSDSREYRLVRLADQELRAGDGFDQ